MTLDRRLHAFRPGLAEASLEGKVAASNFAKGERYRIGASSVPVRPSPRPSASLDTEFLFGEDIIVFDRKDGWAWAKSECDGYVGYLPSGGIFPSDNCQEPTHRISALRTFLFPEPSLKVPPVQLLHHGSRLQIVDTSGKYSALHDGGFVYTHHIRALNDFDTDPVETARRYMYTPYLWGGRSSVGLDCSALVQLAWQACGIPCPRDSDMQQADFGKQIPFDGDEGVLNRGDLVFWKGHVGIWINSQQFLHANASDMCVREKPFKAVADHIDTMGEGPVLSVRRPPMPNG